MMSTVATLYVIAVVMMVADASMVTVSRSYDQMRELFI